MENFFYDDKFYPDLGDLCDDLDLDEEKIAALPDDWQIKVFETSLEPIVVLSADWILDRIDGERFSENDESDKVYKLLQQIDFKLVNEKMPKLYYCEYRKSFAIKKTDLIENS